MMHPRPISNRCLSCLDLQEVFNVRASCHRLHNVELQRYLPAVFGRMTQPVRQRILLSKFEGLCPVSNLRANACASSAPAWPLHVLPMLLQSPAQDVNLRVHMQVRPGLSGSCTLLYKACTRGDKDDNKDLVDVLIAGG